MDTMQIRFLKIFTFLLMLGLLHCASHRYILSDAKPQGVEQIYIEHYFLMGFLPWKKVRTAKDYCPYTGSVYSINMYDSALDGAICGFTFFAYCPHTIAVRCAQPTLGKAGKTRRNKDEE